MSRSEEYSNPTRRDVLRTGGLLTTGAMLGGLWSNGLATAAESQPANRKRALRIGHLTDVHVQPERAADRGFIAALHHVQAQADKPDVIFNGGDAVMDTLAVDASRTGQLWKLWNDTLKQECSLPVEHCLGNHDVWGWNKRRSGTNGQEPLYGKKWALEALGLAKPYHSFDRAGWHFVVLDSTHASDHDVYSARLDNEQFDWLADDLQKVDASTPVCVLSHIPILCVCVFMVAKQRNTETQKHTFDSATQLDTSREVDWVIPDNYTHYDTWRLKELFGKHRNVRLCLSGHVHLVDRVDYNGVTYLCNGAVSGRWWKGKNHEFDAGYALIDLYDDGSFEHQYVEYGWKPQGV